VNVLFIVNIKHILELLFFIEYNKLSTMVGENMKKILSSLLKTYPEKDVDLYIKSVRYINYNRSNTFSIIMLFISFTMGAIAYIEDDLQVIKNLNLVFFISSLTIFVLFHLYKPRNTIITRYHTLLIFIQIVSVVLWSSSLLALVPNRYELFGTYSIVVLSVSSVLYLKWQHHTIIYSLSLIYILFAGFFAGGFLFERPFIPKISTVVLLVAFSWGISRIIYSKFLENYELNYKLETKNKVISTEVIQKTNELFEQQKNQVIDMVRAMNFMLEQYTPYTKGHCDNVAVLAQKIAEDLELSNLEIQETYWSGIIHDIGKLLVPLEILNKKGRLTKEEFGLIKEHPVWAYNALKQLKSLSNVSKNVLHHHEHWDGQGYPSGLVGNSIPIVSQIISVTDAWDAMTSDRPYRDRLSDEDAIEIISTNKSIQFSPLIVDSFLRLYKNDSSFNKKNKKEN